MHGYVPLDRLARDASAHGRRHHSGSAGDHRACELLQDDGARRRRRSRCPLARRRAHLGGHDRSAAAPAPQRGRGDGDRLRRADARGLPAGAGERHQRVRGGSQHVERGDRRDARHVDHAEPRRAAGRHRARVQPHPQRRHAAQRAADGPAVRTAGDRTDRPHRVAWRDSRAWRPQGRRDDRRADRRRGADHRLRRACSSAG